MDFSVLPWQAWFTLLVVATMFAALLFTKIRTEVAFLLSISALYVSGVLSARDAFGGFSTESVVVVAVLYVVIAGLTHTGLLAWAVDNLLGSPKSLSRATARLMLPVAVFSSLLTNTSVVAVFTNVVKIWSKKLGVAPSKLLIPLSYASGMGGICTLIGTPPNLIISGMYAESTGVQLGLFTPLVCGAFCLGVGVLGMLALQRLLPDRHQPPGKADAHNDIAAGNAKPAKTVLAALILMGMTGLSVFKVLPLLSCCLLAAVAMVVCGCCSSAQAMKAINWDIIIVFAGSVAIGKAIEQSGMATFVAKGLLSMCGTNPYVVLTVMCLVVTFATEFISNTAAGAMFFPIAMSSAATLGANPLTFCVALMIAASSSFATPIGSPTHMLVYATGVYNFADFARVGLPMNIIILAANIFITTMVFPF